MAYLNTTTNTNYKQMPVLLVLRKVPHQLDEHQIRWAECSCHKRGESARSCHECGAAGVERQVHSEGGKRPALFTTRHQHHVSHLVRSTHGNIWNYNLKNNMEIAFEPKIIPKHIKKIVNLPIHIVLVCMVPIKNSFTWRVKVLGIYTSIAHIGGRAVIGWKSWRC